MTKNYTRLIYTVKEAQNMYETESIRLSVPLMTNNSKLTNTEIELTQPFGWTDEEKQELIVEIKENWMLTIRSEDY